ncbi:MAG: class I SAM-dependent methyltransferase [Rickettsiales bacterium]|nr:class I SAM-dependent methyltransferase [Pseudomonadota bacterium]MDA0967083.1 class I SAM-dependent methyltransferase [Pseudomonadota bacterium]MDG4542431.1 class I SAM-dependent methyltransferase [Rickettsiales bacterium]MDG4544935.1 class I SAM-dependent methyltransferase [Rickettsiales bacterium]MDG4547058.1 class I SAM-dependent methyltransferase [Rickettsiales bacterium]
MQAKNYKQEEQKIGNESYDERFATFLKNTNQKTLTAKILESLFTETSKNTDIAKDGSLSVMDVGCGEGTLAKQLIPKLQKAFKDTSISYTGLDYNDNFVKKFVEELKEFPGVNISAKKADAFNNEPLEAEKADIIVASHMIYHSYNTSDKEESNKKAGNFVGKIMNKLNNNGIGIMIHEAGSSDMRQIGTNYGSPLMPNATDTIAGICKDSNTRLATIPFEARLNFPTLTAKQWDDLKTVPGMQKAKYNSDMKEAVNLLGFIVQRDLSDLENEKKLPDFVNSVQDKIKDNGGSLVIRSEIQILLSKGISKDFEKAIEECSSCLNEESTFAAKSSKSTGHIL